MNFHSALAEEFQRRRQRNRRYSLRAFAASLGTHHSILSRILHDRRRLTLRTIRRIGPRLLTPAQLSEACVAENCAAILRLVGKRGFRPDTRWISVRTGIPLDAVNVAVQRLTPGADGRTEPSERCLYVTIGNIDGDVARSAVNVDLSPYRIAS